MVTHGALIIVASALLILMAYNLTKTRSRRLTPKERVAQLKRRRPIARKAHLKTCSNSTKQYREVPRWKLERWAREKRATQIDEHGMPIWPAERAFYALLCQILPPSAIRIQEPFYTPQTFILRDFFVPSAKVVFEIDGSTHADKWATMPNAMHGLPRKASGRPGSAMPRFCEIRMRP